MKALTLATLGLPSVVLLWLPFAGDVSPWSTLPVTKDWSWEYDGKLSLLGAPFFLSIPVAVVKVRALLLRTPLSRAERTMCLLLACAALAAGYTSLSMVLEPALTWESGLFCLLWLVLYVSAAWVIVLSAKRLRSDDASVVRLQSAWLPNAIWCAFLFFRYRQIGAYLAAFTVVVYTAVIARAMSRMARGAQDVEDEHA